MFLLCPSLALILSYLCDEPPSLTKEFTGQLKCTQSQFGLGEGILDPG